MVEAAAIAMIAWCRGFIVVSFSWRLAPQAVALGATVRTTVAGHACYGERDLQSSVNLDPGVQ
jgi:hypothetical protein